MKLRIGHGYDAHRFQTGRTLILGGVTVPHHSGLQAHSDGDVVIHALCDALLGALALGDIGQHFPDTHAAYENIDSRLLLKSVIALIHEQQYRVGNVDISILAQAPKLAAFIPQMRAILAEDLKVALADVSIKATTTEKMGFVGREEGIAAYAAALLEKSAC